MSNDSYFDVAQFWWKKAKDQEAKLKIATKALEKYSNYSPTEGYGEKMGQDVGYDAKLALAQIKTETVK